MHDWMRHEPLLPNQLRRIEPASHFKRRSPVPRNRQTSAVGTWASSVGLGGIGNPAGPTPGTPSRCDHLAVARSALIVDDDEDFLGLTARILVELRVEAVSTAANASQALAAVHESQPNAVLVDIGLPDRNGIDLAYELVG